MEPNNTVTLRGPLAIWIAPILPEYFFWVYIIFGSYQLWKKKIYLLFGGDFIFYRYGLALYLKIFDFLKFLRFLDPRHPLNMPKSTIEIYHKHDF